MGLDFLITGNVKLGPIELGSPDDASAPISPPTGKALIVAAGFFLLFLVGPTVWAVIHTGFWRQWVFWKVAPARTGLQAVMATFLAFAAMTEIFSGLTTFLVAHHILGITVPTIPPNRLYADTEAKYVWHFADAIPTLKVPDTLNWKVPYKFTGSTGGALVLLYKVLVIIPVVSLVVGLAKRPRGARSTEEPDVEESSE